MNTWNASRTNKNLNRRLSLKRPPLFITFSDPFEFLQLMPGESLPNRPVAAADMMFPQCDKKEWSASDESVFDRVSMSDRHCDVCLSLFEFLKKEKEVEENLRIDERRAE